MAPTTMFRFDRMEETRQRKLPGFSMFEPDLASYYRNARGRLPAASAPAKGGLCLIAFEVLGSLPKKCDESAAKLEQNFSRAVFETLDPAAS